MCLRSVCGCGESETVRVLLMWLMFLKVGMCSSTREVQVLSALNSTSSSPQQYKRSSSTWGGIRLRMIPPHLSPCCASSMHRGRQQEQQRRQSATTRPSSSSSSSSLSGAESAEKKTALRGHGRGKACLAFFVPLLLRSLTSLLRDTRLVVCFSPVFMNVLQVRNRL